MIWYFFALLAWVSIFVCGFSLVYLRDLSDFGARSLLVSIVYLIAYYTY